MRFTASVFCLLQASGAFAAVGFQPGFPTGDQAMVEAAITNARVVIRQGLAATNPGARLDARVGSVLDASAPPPPGSNQMGVRSWLQARYNAAEDWYASDEKRVTFTHTPIEDAAGNLYFPFINRETGQTQLQRIEPIPDGVNAITVHAHPDLHATDQAHIYIVKKRIYSNTDGSRRKGEDYRRPIDIARNGLRTKLWTGMSSIDGIFRLIEHESFHLEVNPDTGYQKLDDGIRIPGIGRAVYNLPELQSLAKQGHWSLLLADTPAIIARFCSLLTVRGVAVDWRTNGNCPTSTFNQVKDPEGFGTCSKRDGSCGTVDPATDDEESEEEESTKKPTTKKPTNTNAGETDENPTSDDTNGETDGNPSSDGGETSKNPTSSDSSGETDEDPTSDDSSSKGTGKGKPAAKAMPRPPKA